MTSFTRIGCLGRDYAFGVRFAGFRVDSCHMSVLSFSITLPLLHSEFDVFMIALVLFLDVGIRGPH